jgi:hypothetical protein
VWQWPHASAPPAVQAQAAARPAPLLPGQVELTGRFVQGRTKLYSVAEQVRTIQEPRYSQSGNQIFDDYIAGLEIGPESIVRTEFVEAETCERTFDDGSASIAYGVRSYHHSETVADEIVATFEVKTPRDLANLPQDRQSLLVGSLMEAPIRFRLTPAFEVSDLELPMGVNSNAAMGLTQEYERNLEARFKGFFPGRPVAPGDTWESSIPMADSIAGNLYLQANSETVLRSEFIGLEAFEGQQCARIHTTLDFGIAAGTTLWKDTVTDLILDELSAETQVLYDLDRGVVMQDVTSMVFAAHRIIGLEETEKIIAPFRMEKEVRSAFLRFD